MLGGAALSVPGLSIPELSISDKKAVHATSSNRFGMSIEIIIEMSIEQRPCGGMRSRALKEGMPGVTEPLTVYSLPWVECKAVPPKSLTLGQNLRLKKVSLRILTHSNFK